MWNVSGVTGAAPVWLEIMSRLHRNSPGFRPQLPDGVIAKTVDFRNSAEPSRTEWFIKGTEPLNIASAKTTAKPDKGYDTPHIIYPVMGTIVAIDPDIPEDNQKLFFYAEGGSRGLDWSLNNEKIGRSDEPVQWKPVQGKYRLSLVDRDQRMMDSVEFEVRGNDIINGLQ
jgi:penicillin-binding protein 1C